MKKEKKAKEIDVNSLDADLAARQILVLAVAEPLAHPAEVVEEREFDRVVGDVAFDHREFLVDRLVKRDALLELEVEGGAHRLQIFAVQFHIAVPPVT